jgi:thiamine biosynthesis protein ThiI
VIVRFGGEIGIKAEWTRRLYERRLLSNIRAILRHNFIDRVEFIRTFGRLYIKTPKAELTARKLRKVFGISSISPALETTSEIDDIVKTSLKAAKAEFSKDKSFAVHCHRVGKHDYTSQDICRTIGKEILTKLPELKLHVDLTNPKQQLSIEIREQRAYIFTETIKAAGGLPVGTQPKTVCLLKGDTSSTMACWMTTKRGSPAIMLHLRKGQSYQVAKKAAQELAEWTVGFPAILRTVEYDKSLQGFLNRQPTDLRGLLCKRLLLRIAGRVAEKEHAEAIVTGDTLDTSQNETVHALTMQDEAVNNYPVLRPLVGFDHFEIKNLVQEADLKTANARRVAKPRKDKHTKQTTLQDVEHIERRINMDKTLGNITESIKMIRLDSC